MKIYIDLLPPLRKKEAKRNKMFRQILRQETLFLVPILVFISILAVTSYMLDAQKNSIKDSVISSSSQSQLDQLGVYENLFSQVNDNASSLLKIQTNQLHWDSVFVKLSALTPDGITISDITTKNYQMFVLGKAKSRDLLLAFKKQLGGEDCFSDINVPLSNLVVKDNVDFQLDMKIKENCLRQK